MNLSTIASIVTSYSNVNILAMKLLTTFTLFLLSTYSFAQSLTLSQSSPSIEWERIHNEFVDVIYPVSMRSESIYIANLIEHYSSDVGATFNIKKPLLFTLIVRPEVADPNGFVALGPRRSEWFASSNYSTFVGSSEWYQTLAIHEYRHVMQFDYLDRGLINIADYLFGDFGKMLGFFLGVPSWYMEGDAVWAETKYTDAGRGRSPIFLARLKAILLSGEIPTYDEFLNGTYNTYLPNHYVYGYILVSNATKRFGEDFWTKVMAKVASIPHPYRIYSAFESVAKVSFEDFYQQTMSELQAAWAVDKNSKVDKVDYRENLYPFAIGDSLYYLRSSLDNYTQLIKRSGGRTETLVQIPFIGSIQQFHAAGTSALYTEFHPDARYAYKGSSVVYRIDLKTGKRHKLVEDDRLYAPRLNHEGDHFVAVNFTNDQKWVLNEYDIEGRAKRRVVIQDHKFSEAAYVTADQVVAILSDPRGYKQIALVNLNNSQVSTLLAPSRNNIHALSTDKLGNILFEAQYKGIVEIFKFDRSGLLSKCSNSSIASLSPSSDGKAIYYSEIDSYGSHIAKSSLSKCRQIEKSELTHFNYLGPNPSDNYSQFPIKVLEKQRELYSANREKYIPESYGDIDKRLFIPHSWSFVGGRGFQIGVTTDNYLGTMGINAAFGVDSEESENFGNFRLDYKRFYPIFSLHAELRERHVDIYSFANDLEWNEKLAGLEVTLPYLAKSGHYNSKHALSIGASYLDASEYNETNINRPGPDRFFYIYSASASFSLFKDLTYRSIIAPWGFKLEGRYDDAHNPHIGAYSGSRLYAGAKAQTPGLFNHDGLFVTFDYEKQRDSRTAYQFTPWKADVLGYVFSRGYDYEAVAEYRKLTGNYIFPMAYPDLNIWGLYYLRRVFGTLFFDHTETKSQYHNQSMDSYGAQVELESKFFRVLPINWGGRYIHRTRDGKNIAEFYLGTDISY